MRNKVTEIFVFLSCLMLLSLLGESIALSKDQDFDKSDLQDRLEKRTEELSLAARNAATKKLETIKGYLMKGGWDIDKNSGKIVAGNEALRKKITEVQRNVKNLFIVTAEEIEMGNEVKVTVDSIGMVLSTTEKDRKNRFMESTKLSNISIVSQAIAIKALIEINQNLIDSAEREDNRKKRIDWYLTQAIFAYELSSTITEMIDSLSLSYMEDLHNIYNEEMKELSEMEADFNELIDGKNKHLAKGWLEAIEILRENWKSVIAKIEDQEDWVKNIKEKKDEFENFAKMAVYQIRLLGKGIIVEQVIVETDAFRTLLAIDNIPLVGLDGMTFDSLFFMQPLSKEIGDASIKLQAQ